MKKISSSSGIARNVSTTAPAGSATQRCSESLARPKTAPKTSARTAAMPAAFSVPSRPGMMYCVQVSARMNGSQIAGSHCPRSSNLA